ncbi:MAG: hypothetical protein LCH92_08165 [Proteobacteria bacterium]|nr:hypothetical protein [Pseudomonadota bacterium]
MTRAAMSDLGGEYARIFGPRDPLDSAPGRSRLCKTCGGWHPAGRVPHNCRAPAPPRSHLAAPQLAPRFDEFVAGAVGEPEIIGDRKAKREYMERHDFVEYDEGVGHRNTWVEDRKQLDEITATIIQMKNTDTDYYTPDMFAAPLEEGSLAEGTEIDVDAVEAIE